MLKLLVDSEYVDALDKDEFKPPCFEYRIVSQAISDVIIPQLGIHVFLLLQVATALSRLPHVIDTSHALTREKKQRCVIILVPDTEVCFFAHVQDLIGLCDGVKLIPCGVNPNQVSCCLDIYIQHALSVPPHGPISSRIDPNTLYQLFKNMTAGHHALEDTSKFRHLLKG